MAANDDVRMWGARAEIKGLVTEKKVKTHERKNGEPLIFNEATIQFLGGELQVTLETEDWELIEQGKVINLTADIRQENFKLRLKNITVK